MAEVRKVTTPDRFILDINEAEMEYLMDILSARPEAEEEADRFYADLSGAVYSHEGTVFVEQVTTQEAQDHTDGGYSNPGTPVPVPSYRC